MKLTKLQIDVILSKMESKARVVKPNLSSSDIKKTDEYKRMKALFKKYEEVSRKIEDLEDTICSAMKDLINTSILSRTFYYRNSNTHKNLETYINEAIAASRGRFDRESAYNTLVLSTIDKDFDVNAFIDSFTKYMK